MLETRQLTITDNLIRVDIIYIVQCLTNTIDTRIHVHIHSETSFRFALLTRSVPRVQLPKWHHLVILNGTERVNANKSLIRIVDEKA